MFSYKLFKSIKIDRLIKYFYSKLDKMKDQRNWVFVTNSYFLIIVSLQPNVVYRRRVLDILNLNSGRSNNLSLKYQRFTPSSSTDIGIRKLKVVEKLNSFVWNYRLHIRNYRNYRNSLNYRNSKFIHSSQKLSENGSYLNVTKIKLNYLNYLI